VTSNDDIAIPPIGETSDSPAHGLRWEPQVTHPQQNDGGTSAAKTSPGGDRAERTIDPETAAEMMIPGLEEYGPDTTPAPKPRRSGKPRRAPSPPMVALFEIDEPSSVSGPHVHR
jgi:hypothetical protein